jgi:hypothetical protein
MTVNKNSMFKNKIRFYKDDQYETQSTGDCSVRNVHEYIKPRSSSGSIRTIHSPFLENGNYVEVNAIAVDADISGKIRNRPELVNDQQNLNSGNMGNSFQYYSAALKLQLTDRISFGLLYDQPLVLILLSDAIEQYLFGQ